MLSLGVSAPVQTLLLHVTVILQSDKGLVTNYGEGGATKREGGAREVLPLRKGGAEKVLAVLKGGHKKFWGSFLRGSLKF